ncbi:dipeptidase [Halobium salinum]|uniref:Dipeptidase n=1 Tax=Halobium salinum TaxID=1364940 RepID=A0ABD5PCR8_9EURY|nr:dipeptidase [Halobium salinum]
MTASPPPVFDGHNDTLLDLHLDERGGGRSFFGRSDAGHIDLPRAREGGFAGGCFAMFVPSEVTHELVRTDDGYDVPFPPPLAPDYARRYANDLLDRLHRLEAASEGALRVVESASEIESCLSDPDGPVAALPHLEGADPVAPDLSNLDALYGRGVRSIGLTWARENAFAHGAPFRYPASPDSGPGLTDRGEALVRACNERGIVVDCAHLDEAGVRDVARVSEAPLVVSHAGVHGICPSARNVSDATIDAVGDSDGVVGVSFAVEGLRPDGEQEPDTPLATVVDHVAYVAERIGVEGVALGSDFDGATVPESVGDVTGLPRLFEALADRGFTRRERERIAHGNWLRVLEATLGG